jgi:hypothetical protein
LEKDETEVMAEQLADVMAIQLSAVITAYEFLVRRLVRQQVLSIEGVKAMLADLQRYGESETGMSRDAHLALRNRLDVSFFGSGGKPPSEPLH